MTEQPIQRIGDYLLHRQVGRGGMGRVYEAEELLSRRRVALKILDPELGQSPTGRRQFVSEMAILSSLDDPHIVRCLHCAEIDGQLVMVLELLPGQTLRAALDQNGRLAWPQVVEIATQIGLALHAAHSRQPAIIHRDLKPENVMWLPDGRIKVMDFGIAKILATIGGGTATSQAFGTLQYMSPEQIDARSIDARSDLYALGLVMWELLAGRPPFQSDSPRLLLEKLCIEPAPALPEDVTCAMPPRLGALIAALLEKPPERRPGSAIEVVHALTPMRAWSAPAAEPVVSAPIHTPAPIAYDTIAVVEQARVRPSPRWGAIVLVGIGIACVLFVVWLMGGFRERKVHVGAASPLEEELGDPEPAKSDATTQYEPVNGPFETLAAFCATKVERECAVHTGDGAARQELPGFGQLEVVSIGSQARDSIGLMFTSAAGVYVLEPLVDHGGDERMLEAQDGLRTTSIGGDTHLTIEFVVDRRETIDSDRVPRMLQAEATWTDITTIQCQIDPDDRPRCTKPVIREEARGAPTTAARERWLVTVDYAIAQLKIPRYVGLPPELRFEFTLEICKDGSIARVTPTAGSDDSSVVDRVTAELVRLQVPKPPAEVAATMTGECELFDYPFAWSPESDE